MAFPYNPPHDIVRYTCSQGSQANRVLEEFQFGQDSCEDREGGDAMGVIECQNSCSTRGNSMMNDPRHSGTNKEQEDTKVYIFRIYELVVDPHRDRSTHSKRNNETA